MQHVLVKAVYNVHCEVSSLMCSSLSVRFVLEPNCVFYRYLEVFHLQVKLYTSQCKRFYLPQLGQDFPASSAKTLPGLLPAFLILPSLACTHC